MKVYLLYKKRNSNFSYQIKDYLCDYLKSINDEVVTNIDEADYILSFLNSDENNVISSYLYSKKIKILALLENSDYTFINDSLALSQNAYNIYLKADEILVFSKTDKEFLEKCNIKTRITIIPYLINRNRKPLLNIEKDAFKKYFQIDKNNKVIVSFSSFLDNKDYLLLEALARNTADVEFIYFGQNDHEQIKKSLQQRLTVNRNILYVESLPSELYLSMLNSVDALLITSKVISYPTVIFDFLAYKIPIVLNKNLNLNDILSSTNCKIGNDFESIFKLIKSIN